MLRLLRQEPPTACLPRQLSRGVKIMVPTQATLSNDLRNAFFDVLLFCLNYTFTLPLMTAAAAAAAAATNAKAIATATSTTKKNPFLPA